MSIKNNQIYNQTGAMFGLDARIALAIFGTLSVITGASLYSAIKKAKAIAILNEMSEFGKAWEQFYLDTGIGFVNATTYDAYNPYVMEPFHLVTSTLKYWKGPYISKLNNLNDNQRYLMKLSTDTLWPNPSQTNGWRDGSCTTGKKCAIWSRVYVSTGPINNSLALSIDKIVDNSDGKSLGNFRWDSGYNLKIATIKNPND